MSVFLGIDIGTSGTKTLAIDEEGKILGSAMETYPCYVPKPLWSEQDPEDWWQGTIKSVRRVMKLAKLKSGDVKAIGLSRPDAWFGLSRQAKSRGSQGDSLERPAHLSRMRRDRTARRRPCPIDPDGRQPGDDRLYGAQDPLAPQP